MVTHEQRTSNGTNCEQNGDGTANCAAFGGRGRTTTVLGYHGVDSPRETVA